LRYQKRIFSPELNLNRRLIQMNKSKKYLLATASRVIFLTALAAYSISTVAPQGALGTVAPELEGTWRVTVTPDDANPPFPVLLTFAGGGVC
jgi:hypothetical protein